MDGSRLVDEVASSLRETAEAVTPWFLKNMPQVYFQDTDHATQLVHLRAIIASRASGRPIELTLRSEDGSQWTSMRPLDYPGVLAELAKELPIDSPLRAAKIHTATDGQLVLDTFEFGDTPLFDENDPEQAAKLKSTLAYAKKQLAEWPDQEVIDFFRRCNADYVMTVTPLRMSAHWALFKRVSGTDGTAVQLEDEADPCLSRIVITVGNSTRRSMLERIAERMSRSGINIRRAYLDTIDDGANGSISMLGFVVQGPDGNAIDPESELWRTVYSDLLRIKWLDLRTLSLAYRHPELDLTRAEIITALVDLSYQVLVKENPYAFTPIRLTTLAERNLDISLAIANLFLDRFNPDQPLSDADFEEKQNQLDQHLSSNVDLEDSRMALRKMLEAVGAVLRTNIYLPDRYALSMRVEPQFLATSDRPVIPFGVFFVHGRGFNGFHVRFRDIARGGVRAVHPRSADQFARESERLYDEAFNLASAQQLKNKDIPEGGAKATLLISPKSRITRSVKAFVDSILDLITPDPEIRSQVYDRFGQDELLYFGPDEGITPAHIDWIVDRAERRGYPLPTALMSSKPGAGINHKEYGVTSEGVHVFLRVGLETIGIDPEKDTFSIKITGGPDGDVAGNLIQILDTNYGDRCKIVGIADGSGCAEDPDGLNHHELLRLFRAALPIASFDQSQLGNNGRTVAIDEPDGVHLRNSLHNRVKADAFVPCGGRPNSIHEKNAHEFLDADGQPSSKLIVEGANLFLTPDARQYLSEHGTLILKDSSANKCGVICSSYEIAACMLLSEEQFLSIKPVFVAQVIDKLRDLARREVELLTRLHRQQPQVPVPDLSIRLSRVMIRTADAIEAAIEQVPESQKHLLQKLVQEHLPEVLVDMVGDEIWTRLPQTYLNWVMAKSLAARIAYRDGIDYLETMPASEIAGLAVQYLALELERKQLASEVANSNLPDRKRIVEILDSAGIISTISPDFVEPEHDEQTE